MVQRIYEDKDTEREREREREREMIESYRGNPEVCGFWI